MRATAVAAIVGVLATAAAAQRTPLGSGLYGVVKRGPTRPVCIADLPCSGPARNLRFVFSRNGREVARTTTGDDGSFRVGLRPGTYTVRATGRRGPRRLEPATAHVPPGRFARVNFFLDTGIR